MRSHFLSNWFLKENNKEYLQMSFPKTLIFAVNVVQISTALVHWFCTVVNFNLQVQYKGLEVKCKVKREELNVHLTHAGSRFYLVSNGVELIESIMITACWEILNVHIACALARDRRQRKTGENTGNPLWETLLMCLQSLSRRRIYSRCATRMEPQLGRKVVA